MQEKLRKGVQDPALGVLADILVRPCLRHKGRDFELVDGEHRYEVYKRIGLEAVEAKVADLADAASGPTTSRTSTSRWSGGSSSRAASPGGGPSS